MKIKPAILIGVGLTGLVTTAVMAYKYAPKVNLVLADAEKDAEENNEKFGVPQKAKVVVKTLWPVFAIGLLSGLTIIYGGYSEHKNVIRTTAALARSEKSLRDYQESVLAEVGEETARNVRQRMAEKRYYDSDGPTVVYTNDSSKQLFFDSQLGTYFSSDMNTVDAAINEVNARLLDSDFVSWNDWFDELDNPKELPHIDIGDKLGWDYHFDGKLVVHKYAKITDDGRSCIVLDYEVFPHTYRHDR
jgi:hypothetical protein